MLCVLVLFEVNCVKISRAYSRFSKDLILVDSWTLVDFSPSGIEPRGVSFDDRGRLFVALGNRNEVRAFDLDLGIELVRYKIETEAENIVFRNGSIYVGGSESITRIRLHR